MDANTKRVETCAGAARGGERGQRVHLSVFLVHRFHLTLPTRSQVFLERARTLVIQADDTDAGARCGRKRRRQRCRRQKSSDGNRGEWQHDMCA